MVCKYNDAVLEERVKAMFSTKIHIGFDALSGTNTMSFESY
jgi:hypothetical protein